ncbi:MAG: outer membrane lipoprotein-sorting protein [Alphaproteobacteria bacterium]|nr:outer membrane lipoprotein-sorting protein [Alphaproteobacteria bacterium]
MLAFVIALAQPASAETADEVIAKARAANQVTSAIETLHLTIVSKSGQERVKDLELRSRREGDVNKSYLKVTAPSAEAGTQLLMIDHPDQADEQMMYLPQFKRVNYISGSGKKNAFLGSDFTFEDLEIRQAASTGWTMAEDGADTWILESTPGSDSSYAKIRLHVTKATTLISKVELFDGNGLRKVLEVKKTETDGAVTLPVETVMTDMVKGTHTVIQITTHQLNVGTDVLPDETFTKAYLERG